MNELFKKEQIYNSAAITTIFMDAYPNRFTSFKACRVAVCIATTELLTRGKIALVNKQTKNRLVYGSDAQKIVNFMNGNEVDSKQLVIPDLPLPTKNEMSTCETIDFSGWVTSRRNCGNGRESDVIVRINKNGSNSHRLVIRFSKSAMEVIFGNSRKVSFYISKHDPKLFIVPDGVEGAGKFALTKQGDSFRVGCSVEKGMEKFVGDYSIDSLIICGLAKDGMTYKAWGFDKEKKE